MTVAASRHVANMRLFKILQVKKMTIIWHLIWRQGPFSQSVNKKWDQICLQTWRDERKRMKKKWIQRQLRAKALEAWRKKGREKKKRKIHSIGAFQHLWPSIPLDNNAETSCAAQRTLLWHTFTLNGQYLSFHLYIHFSVCRILIWDQYQLSCLTGNSQ